MKVYRMPDMHQVPYFPYGCERKGDTYTFIDPIHTGSIELNSSAFTLLDLCDGKKSLADITRHLICTTKISRSEVTRKAEPILQLLSEKGLLWWRSKPSKVWRLPPPRAVLWDLTNRCNLACKHCVVSGGERDTKDLSLNTCLRFVDEAAEFGVTQLILSGGEPLMRKDFFIIAERAVEKNLQIQLASNATLVTIRIASRLLELGAFVQVSLDGYNEETHDGFRGINGAWTKTIKGLENLIAVGVPVVLACVVNRLNINEIPKLYEFAAQLGADTFRIMPFVPFGRGREAKDLEVHPNQMRDLTQWLLTKRKANGIRIAPMEFECTFAPSTGPLEDQNARVGCDGGFTYVTLTSNGDVLPCNFFHGIKADNIAEHSFRDIWNNSAFINYFRSITVKDIRGSCHQCSWLASCRGSCLAANYAHGDLFQSNIHCWNANEIKETIKEDG